MGFYPKTVCWKAKRLYLQMINYMQRHEEGKEFHLKSHFSPPSLMCLIVGLLLVWFLIIRHSFSLSRARSLRHSPHYTVKWIVVTLMWRIYLVTQITGRVSEFHEKMESWRVEDDTKRCRSRRISKSAFLKFKLSSGRESCWNSALKTQTIYHNT
jgi:hypothetical protein